MYIYIYIYKWKPFKYELSVSISLHMWESINTRHCTNHVLKPLRSWPYTAYYTLKLLNKYNVFFLGITQIRNDTFRTRWNNLENACFLRERYQKDKSECKLSSIQRVNTEKKNGENYCVRIFLFVSIDSFFLFLFSFPMQQILPYFTQTYVVNSFVHRLFYDIFTVLHLLLS